MRWLGRRRSFGLVGRFVELPNDISEFWKKEGRYLQRGRRSCPCVWLGPIDSRSDSVGIRERLQREGECVKLEKGRKVGQLVLLEYFLRGREELT